MKRANTLFHVTLAAVLSLAGCATDRGTTYDLSGTREAPPASPDTDFVTRAAQSDMAELEMSRLAQQKADTLRVRDFASHMLSAHTQTSTDLKNIAQDERIAVPSTLAPEQQRALDELARYSGDEFERRYMDAQVKAHEEAIELFEQQASEGKSPELKQFAQSTLPNLRQHLETARRTAAEARS